MRKKLLEVSNFERQRILKEHNKLRTSKLIKEDTGSDNAKKVAKLFVKSGIPIDDTNEAWYDNGCWTVLIVDGAGNNNIWVNICDKGYFALKGENYEVETFHGNWFIDSNGQAVVTLNGDSQFNQRVSVDKTNLSVHDGSLRGPLVCWLLREKRFYLVWTTVSDWSWMWDDLMEISQSNCTKLTGDIKELQQKFSDNQSGFWQALGDFLF